MVNVSETEEEYIIEIPHKNDFDLLIFTRENLAQLGLFAKITVKQQEPSSIESFFSGGSDRSVESNDLTIPYKWFHAMLIGNKTNGRDVTESETLGTVRDESIDNNNNKLTLDYFTSFFKPTKGETPSTTSEIVKLEPEPVELKTDVPVESEPVEPITDVPVEPSITIRIKKNGLSKIVKLKDHLKEIYDGPRTIEDVDETGMNYILLEKITFDLYKQFETLVQVHIVPTELNPEYIYNINGIYVYLDNSKMIMINDETELLMRRNKDMLKTLIEELILGKSENKIKVIENTRVSKLLETRPKF